MYELKINLDFSSAHNLRGYQGICESLHGHNWHVQIIVTSPKLSDMGLVIDFKELKSISNEILDQLDHKYLNELDYFKDVNPSSENIAKYIFDELMKRLEGHNAMLSKVVVYESKGSSAAYYDEG